MVKGAIFSPNGKYRYSLTREWDKELPKITFLMLNPSTADGTTDDPTVNKCISYAQSWGYGGLIVVNLFAHISTDPRGLFNSNNPTGGFRNFDEINAMAKQCDKVICAWGHSDIISRLDPSSYYVKNLTKVIKDKLYYIEMSVDGVTPKHPLYLSSSIQPIKFNLHETPETV